jgi:hypothetical protein
MVAMFGTSAGSLAADGNIEGPVYPVGALDIGYAIPVGPVLICEFAVIFNSEKRTRCRDFKEPQVLREQMAMQDPKDPKDFKEHEDFKVHREHREPRAMQDRTEAKEARDHRGLVDSKVVREPRALKATRAFRDLP